MVWRRGPDRTMKDLSAKLQGIDDFYGDRQTEPAPPEWEAPVPLDDPTGPEPPAGALPEPVQMFVDALATSTQTPRGLGTALAIAALSAAARGRYAVSLTDFDRDHAEPLVLHTAAVMAPAERKTAVFNAVAAPLNAVAQERNRDEAIPVREWNSKLEVLEKRHKAAVDAEAAGPKKGKEGGSTTDAATLESNRKAAVQALHDHLQAVIYPTTLLADDITNQRLKELMVQNRGAIAVVSDEGTFLEVLAGRHSDGVAQLETILNGHTGGKVDMQRKSSPPLYWPRGYLTIGLAVQHHVIETWGTTDGVTGKGAAARLMAVFPPSRVGERDTNAPRVPDALTVGWDALIRRLLDYKPNQSPDTAGYPLPCELRLSTDAWRIYKPHWEWIESQLKPGAAYGDFKDWAGKLHGATLRLAGFIHLASEVQPDVFKISGHTMQCAIALSLWFAAHARIMYRVMAGRSGQSAARQVLNVIRELRTPTTKREIHRKLQDRVAFQKADDLTAPLALLEDYGWVRSEREGKSLNVFLNPLQNPDNTDSAPRNQSQRPSLSVLSGYSGESPKNENGLRPTGTDGDGARPGEVKL